MTLITLITQKGEQPITAVIAGKPDQLVDTTTCVLNGS
jgi:hypothetical protein